MSEISQKTLYGLYTMMYRVKREFPGKRLAYIKGGRKACIISEDSWSWGAAEYLIDIEPHEWLDRETLLKRLEVSLIERMIAGEE